MQEQTINEPKSLGLEFEVKKNTKNANRIGFSNTIFAVGERVYVLSAKQQDDLIKQLNELNRYKSKIKELEQSIAKESNIKTNENLEKDIIIESLKTEINELRKQVSIHDRSIDKLQQEIKDKDENIASLKKELNYNEIHLKYLKNSYENLMELNSNYKETIEKQQSSIYELSKKIESLFRLKDYISPKQHYDEVGTLKDKIKDAETENNKVKAEVERKLATQKSDLEIAYTNEKAQMLVAYNQELNHHKMKYNELAMDYNQLLSDANSLSRINTLFNGRHKSIVKDKTPVELTDVEIEKEETDTIEYVPKEEVKLI